MKRSFFSLLGAAALLAVSGQQSQPTANDGIGQVVEQTPTEKPAPKAQAARAEQPVVAIRQMPSVPYSAVRYKDISGPRRVKYGNRRWVQLS